MFRKIKGGLNSIYINLLINPNTPNNLKTLTELRRLNIIDDNDFFLDEDGNIIIDPISQEPFEYKKAILINGNLYHIDGLYKWVFEENSGNYKKIDIFRNTINIIDTFKIYNLFKKINPYLDEIKSKFHETYRNVIQKCQEIDDIINTINDLLKEDLDDEILKTINDKKDTILSEIKNIIDMIKSISDINNNLVFASINFTNTLINFFNFLKNFVLVIYNLRNNSSALFKGIIDFFEKINDILSYNFEIFIAYSLKTTNFTEEYKREFKKNINKIIEISNQTINKSNKIYYNNYIIYILLFRLKNIINSHSNLNPKRRKLLLKTYETIHKEFLKSLKIYSQENSLNIYRFSNSLFIKFVERKKNNEKLVMKAEQIFGNIEKLHSKSIKSYEKASSVFHKYQIYTSPNLKQRFQKSIRQSVRAVKKVLRIPVSKSSKSSSKSSSPHLIEVSSPSP